jgi:hypothetical protein
MPYVVYLHITYIIKIRKVADGKRIFPNDNGLLNDRGILVVVYGLMLKTRRQVDKTHKRFGYQ